MGCESNGFCRSLSATARRKLCSHCHRQLLGSGSIENYIDTRKHCLLLLDGFITGIGYGDANLRNWPDVHFSRFLVIMPGYLIGYRELSDKSQDIMFASSFLRCETSCCVARFDQTIIDEASLEFPEVRRAAAESLFEWTIEMSEFLSLTLKPSACAKIETLLAFLARRNQYCSETRIAELLGCSRASVTRAFSSIAKSNPRLLDSYRENKNRPVTLLNPE